MKKPKLKLIAGVVALTLLLAVLALVNRPSPVQAQDWMPQDPWRIVPVTPGGRGGDAYYPPALLINRYNGHTWALYCGPGGCRWVPVER